MATGGTLAKKKKKNPCKSNLLEPSLFIAGLVNLAIN